MLCCSWIFNLASFRNLEDLCLQLRRFSWISLTIMIFITILFRNLAFIYRRTLWNSFSQAQFINKSFENNNNHWNIIQRPLSRRLDHNSISHAARNLVHIVQESVFKSSFPSDVYSIFCGKFVEDTVTAKDYEIHLGNFLSIELGNFRRAYDDTSYASKAGMFGLQVAKGPAHG